MPPVDAAQQQLQTPHPVVAAAQVSELVGQERVPLLSAEPVPQGDGNEQPRRPAHAHSAGDIRAGTNHTAGARRKPSRRATSRVRF